MMRRVQQTGFINQLLDVHRAVTPSAMLPTSARAGCPGNAGGLAQLRMNLAENNPDRWLDREAVMITTRFPTYSDAPPAVEVEP